MGDINDDFGKENIEITGGSPVKSDDELGAGAASDKAADTDLTVEDDELDAKELDIPYKDEEESI